MIKTVILSGSILLFLIALLIFKPVPITTEDQCLQVEGIVTDIFEGGVKDVIIKLRDDDRTYYINRGLQRGLELKELRNKLIHNQVQLFYPQYWTPLDPNNSTKHIAKLSYGKEVIFNEMK